MDSKYQINNSVIANAGDGATFSNINFTQTNNTSSIDFGRLTEEIQQLKLAFQKSIQSQGDEEALKKIEAAEKAARGNDLNAVVENFKSVGKGIAKLAKEIGVELVASLIAKQVGI